MISWLVGKCHVADSYLTVLRFVVSKIKGGVKTFRALSREERRKVISATFKAHKENRELFRQFRF